MSNPVRVLSHRGLGVDRAENTLAAFEAALAHGCDGIETDVRRSADGLAVLFHDERLADGRAVADLSRDELSRALGSAVPTLAEALDRWPDVFWNIELKTADAAEGVVAALAGRALPGGVLLSSFRHHTAKEAGHRSGRPYGFILGHRPLRRGARIREARRAGASAVVMRWSRCNPALIDLARAEGLDVYVYGFETRADQEACTRLPVTGVVVDLLPM